MIKKLIIALSIAFVGLLIAAYAVLYFYKTPILNAVDQQMNENIRGKVYFDHDKTSLSMFRHMPYLTVRLGDFGVINAEPFLGDTLLAIDAFDLSIDWWAALSGRYHIQRIYLENPRIQVTVLEDGRASYDIAIADTTTAAEAPELDASAADSLESSFELSIHEWVIENADIHYEDRAQNILAQVQGLTHEGSGNISLAEYDLQTKTRIEDLYLRQEGITYASHLSVEAQVSVQIDNNTQTYTLLENDWKINDFGFSLTGQVAMHEETIDTDIRIASEKNTFKSLLSLVPKSYIKDYENMLSEGSLQFEGQITGPYTDTRLPAFSLLVQVENATVHYADLPQKLEQIDLHVRVDNQDGIIDNTQVKITRLHAVMGDNRIEGQVDLRNLRNYEHTASLQAALNIEEVSQLAPLDDLVLKGMCQIEVQSSGTYDSTNATIPVLDIAISLSEGYAQHSDYPIPVERMALRASIQNSSGRMQDTRIAVDPCEMWIDNEKVQATLFAENLDNITWDLSLLGKVNMETLTNVFPIEGAKIKGIVDINVRSKGSMDKVERERYDQMYTQGEISLQDFAYDSPDLPQPLSIHSARLRISSQELRLQELRGTFGQTALALSGSISNYIPYAIQEHATLKGYLKLQSPRVQVSEFMTYEESPASTKPAQTSAPATSATPAKGSASAKGSEEVVAIPQNLDLQFDSDIQSILYEGFTLENFRGRVTLRKGVLALENLSFRLFEGMFALRGSYVTPPRAQPRYDVNFEASRVSIAAVRQSSDMVKKLAPIAKDAEGFLSLDMAMQGQLDKTLAPVLPSVYGKGSLLLQETKVQGGPLWEKIAERIGASNNAQGLYLDKVRVQIEIKDGRLYVAPFTVRQGEYALTTQGSNGLDGSIDYTSSINAPTPLIAQQLGVDVPDKIMPFLPKTMTLSLRTTGTYQRPQVSLDKGTKKQLQKDVSSALKQAAKQEAKKAAKKVVKDNQKKIENKAKKAIKGLFGKKKKKDG